MSLNGLNIFRPWDTRDRLSFCSLSRSNHFSLRYSFEIVFQYEDAHVTVT